MKESNFENGYSKLSNNVYNILPVGVSEIRLSRTDFIRWVQRTFALDFESAEKLMKYCAKHSIIHFAYPSGIIIKR